MPMHIKVRLTENRIREWVNEYGEDGVYVAFSGGKDSTVLLDIARRLYPNLKAMFVDVPTQFPELRQFVQTFPNVDIVKPKMSFPKVCEMYGFPIISKEVSESVYGARRYIEQLIESGIISTDGEVNKKFKYHYFYENVCGTGQYAKDNDAPDKLEKIMNQRIINKEGGSNTRLALMLGWSTMNSEKPVQKDAKGHNKSKYSHTKYKFFLKAPFEISSSCCNIMKKNPSHQYGKKTGRYAITAQMADESRLRTQKWLMNGCNGFNMKRPTSNPMSFWTEQDVLEYIVAYNIPICSVYGEVVPDNGAEFDEQISIWDLGLMKDTRKLKTTGCSRTGCVLCGFGVHLEENPNRFEQLKETHPKMYQLLDLCKNNGITYREAIDWINEHGNINIKY